MKKTAETADPIYLLKICTFFYLFNVFCEIKYQDFFKLQMCLIWHISKNNKAHVTVKIK